MKKIIIIMSLIFIFMIDIFPMYDTDIIHLDETFQGISKEHILGTDHLGRDIFSLIVQGGVRTLMVVGIGSFTSLLFGMTLGLLSGYLEGIFETLVQFVTDLTMIIPSFILALTFTAIFGLSPVNIGIVLGITGIGAYVNQTASLTKNMKENEFILAARVLGNSDLRIMIKHIFPNIIRPIFTLFGNKASQISMQYASLSFIGLGTDLTEPDWGAMLFQYRVYIIDHPSIVLWPSMAIFIMAIIFQYIFDDQDITGVKRGNIYD